MRRFAKTLIATLAVSSLIVTPVFAEPGTGGLESQKEAAQGEVSALQSQLTKIMIQMDETETGMITKGESIIQANADLVLAQEKEKTQYEAMKLRIKYMYETGDSKALEKILSSGSIAELLNQAEYIQSVHGYDRKQLQEYVATKNQIADLKSTLETEMKSLEKLKDDFSQQQASLGTALSSKEAEVANLDGQIQAAAVAAAAAIQEQVEEQNKQVTVDSAGGVASSDTATGGGNSSSNDTSGTKPSTPDAGAETPNKPTEPAKPNPPANNGESGSGNTSKASAIVSAAWNYIGVPYVLGGTSMSGIDCSGLTMMCHRAAGINIPRTSGSQAGSGKSVSGLGNALPGDIICYPGHVALYIGGGQVIHAPEPGKSVKVAGVSMGASQPITAIRRYW